MNTLSFTAPKGAMRLSGSMETRRDTFAEAAFIAFLLLIFVTLKPFAVRDMAVMPLGDAGTGGGDLWRQICFLAAFSALAMSAWRRVGSKIFSAMPPLLVLLLGWCLLSSAWAQAPDVAMRRAVLEIIMVFSAMLGVQAVGPERALGLLRQILVAVLVVNFVSILLVHQAVHLSDESDRQLIGNWRGLYFHKNIAGAVSAITAILFFFQAAKTKRLLHWVVFGGAVIFTVMTRSKTSLGLLPLALVAGMVFSARAREATTRHILVTGAALLVVIGCAVLAAEYVAIARYLTNPAELTGRVAIWNAELAFIRDHLFLGAGFGSFADTGALSPLYNYVADRWVQSEVQGHNAYLQMLVTIGAIGFGLALLALVAQPALMFRRLRRTGSRTFLAPLFAIFTFVVLHNFFESDFLEGDGPVWITFLLVLACLRAPCLLRRDATKLTNSWTAP